MITPGSALIDPLANDVDVRRRERLVGRRWRHLLVSVVSRDAAEQFTVRRRNIDHVPCRFGIVETQVRLARLVVRTVAVEAVIGQDRQHMATKANRFICQQWP
jgi:hypothetical protein